MEIHSNNHKMNCPSRTDNPNAREGWNQSPNLHSGTTREDFNGMANTRVLRRIEPGQPVSEISDEKVSDVQRPGKTSEPTIKITTTATGQSVDEDHLNRDVLHCDDSGDYGNLSCLPSFLSKTRKVLVTYSKFVGPGFMVCTPLRVDKRGSARSAFG